MPHSVKIRPTIKKFVSPALNKTSLNHLVPNFSRSCTIPKNIYQTYRDEIIPEDLTNCTNRLAIDNPGWQHTLISDAKAVQFIRDNYGLPVLKLFLRINPDYGPARADLIRYLLLYRFGGAYMDLKSSGVLDDGLLPDDQFLVSQWPQGNYPHWGNHDELQEIPGGEYQQWCLACTAGHPLMRAVIGRVLGNISVYNPFLHGTGKKGVLRVTGPIAYTLAIHPLLHRYPHRVVDTDKLHWAYSILQTSTTHESYNKSHYST